MSPLEIGKLWAMIMDEYQNIENVEGFYDYVTNTWIDDGALFCIMKLLWFQKFKD